MGIRGPLGMNRQNKRSGWVGLLSLGLVSLVLVSVVLVSLGAQAQGRGAGRGRGEGPSRAESANEAMATHEFDEAEAQRSLDRARKREERSPHLVLATSVDGREVQVERAAMLVAQQLREIGQEVPDWEVYSKEFQLRHSREAVPVEAADLRALAQCSEKTLNQGAFGYNRGALRSSDACVNQVRGALESVNRQPRAAANLFNGCMYSVRASIDMNRFNDAFWQCVQCRRLVPDITLSARYHPPPVHHMYRRAMREEDRAPKATFRVHSQPTGCAVYVNGRKLGNTPFTMEKAEYGVYRVQTECEPGVMVDVDMDATGRSVSRGTGSGGSGFDDSGNDDSGTDVDGQAGSPPGRVHHLTLGAYSRDVFVDVAYDRVIYNGPMARAANPLPSHLISASLAAQRRAALEGSTPGVSLRYPSEVSQRRRSFSDSIYTARLLHAQNLWLVRLVPDRDGSAGGDRVRLDRVEVATGRVLGNLWLSWADLESLQGRQGAYLPLANALSRVNQGDVLELQGEETGPGEAWLPTVAQQAIGMAAVQGFGRADGLGEMGGGGPVFVSPQAQKKAQQQLLSEDRGRGRARKPLHIPWGTVALGAGAVSLAGAWATWVHRHQGGDAEVESSRLLYGATGVLGAGLLSVGAAALAPEMDPEGGFWTRPVGPLGIPGWAYVSGAAGLGLGGLSAYFLHIDGYCETEDNAGTCLVELSNSGLAWATVMSAVPLLSVPVTYWVRGARGDSTGAGLSLQVRPERAGASLVLGGRL